MRSISTTNQIYSTSVVEQVDRLNQQAWELRATDSQQAIILSEQAIALATKTDYQEGLARGLYISGFCRYLIVEYDPARTRLLLALALYEELEHAQGQADALNTLGNLCSGLGDHHSALEFYLQSLDIRRNAGFHQAMAASLNNIGNVYFHLADYPNALESHLLSLSIKQELGDRQGIGTSLNNIGNVYKELGDYEHALQRYDESLAIFQSIEHLYGEAGALGNIGVLYAILGDAAAARAYHQHSLLIERQISNKLGEADSLLRLGELSLQYHQQLGEPPEQAMNYLHQALNLAQELESKELLYKVHLALSQAYQQQGDFAAALSHYQAYHTEQRIVFDQELSEKTKKLQIIHQVETSKREMALQRAEAEVFRLRNVELAAALTDTSYHRQVAEQASRLKSELLSIAAHDLKNPLGAIRGYAELLLLQTPAESPGNQIAERISYISNQMLAIITDLLELATIENGNLQLNIKRSDLSALGALVIERNYAQAAQKGQIIHFNAEPGCIADVDQIRIQEILDNLLSNAIKYSAQEQPIWVSVAHHGANIRMTVKDSGQGLTPEDQERLYGKFVRLSAKPTGGESSTGLGLSIVKLLVDLHGGSIWAESAGRGTGSTFIVEIPASAEIPAAH